MARDTRLSSPLRRPSRSSTGMVLEREKKAPLGALRLWLIDLIDPVFLFFSFSKRAIFELQQMSHASF